MKIPPRNLNDEKDKILNELERYETIFNYYLNSRTDISINGRGRENRLYASSYMTGTIDNPIADIKSNFSYLEYVIIDTTKILSCIPLELEIKDRILPKIFSFQDRFPSEKINKSIQKLK